MKFVIIVTYIKAGDSNEDGKERYLKKDGKWYELKEQGKLELESK